MVRTSLQLTRCSGWGKVMRYLGRIRGLFSELYLKFCALLLHVHMWQRMIIAKN